MAAAHAALRELEVPLPPVGAFVCFAIVSEVLAWCQRRVHPRRHGLKSMVERTESLR